MSSVHTFMKRAALLSLLLCVVSLPLSAADDFILNLADKPAEKTDDKPAEGSGGGSGKYDVTFHGYAKLWGIIKKWDKFVYADVDQGKMNARAQLKFEGFLSSWGHVYTALNFDYTLDCKNPEEKNFNKITGFKVVEGYFDWYATEWLNFRIGRQMILWGFIEGIETPTDIITPSDYDTETVEFEDSRIAPDVFAINFPILGKYKIELLWLPVFTPANLPTEEVRRKGKIEPFADPIVPKLRPPERTIENGEYAIRFSVTYSFFKMAAAYLYGWDDMPDGLVIYSKNGSTPDQSTLRVFLENHRMQTSTLDLSFDIKDTITLKTCGAFYLTEDLAGRKDQYKNSFAKYLIGVESANIVWNIYFSCYLGQTWIVNYTPVHPNYSGKTENADKVVENELPNYDMLLGYDQLWPYKWLASMTVQRSFLQGNSLELIYTYALSTSPKWNSIDYAMNASVSYKIIAPLSISLAGVFTQKMGVVRNYVILGMKYVF